MRQRILIVEDDADLRALLLESLRAAGYDTCAAADGIEGLRNIVDDPPDLVLTDVLMPGFTGLELCTLLKASPRTTHIPVIFLSCVEDVLGGFEVGADDYLVKPFRHRELLARVQAVFRRTEAVPPALAGGGLRGNLAELSLPEILQTLHIGRASGCLAAVDTSSSDVVRLWLDSGELVAARLEGSGSFSGEEALFRAIAWDEGVFSFDSTDRERSRTMHSSLETLLLEAARLTDEGEADEADAKYPVREVSARTAVALDRAGLEERINGIRDRLKVKAFEALMEGRRLNVSGAVPETPPVDAGVILPDELDELVERMLSGE
ncbi:MAG: response regulator [Thermoleophilia bacterium]